MIEALVRISFQAKTVGALGRLQGFVEFIRVPKDSIDDPEKMKDLIFDKLSEDYDHVTCPRWRVVEEVSNNEA